MKLEQLSYFVAAAKEEHIGKAAKLLAISPSAVSHSIAALEEELGRELFIKRGKHIQLTSHGKLLLELATALLRSAESIKHELKSEGVEVRGHYRLAASHLVCSKYLTPAWAETQRLFPGLTSEIFTLRSAQVLSGVIEGDYDAGVCFNPHDHPELSRKSLHEGQIVVALRSDHPLFSARPDNRISKLSQYPAVLPKAFQGIDVCEQHPVFEKFGIEPRPDVLIDSYEVAMEKIARSDSWGFVPAFLLNNYAGRIKPLPVPEGWDAKYFVAAIWRNDQPPTKVLKSLFEQLAVFFEARPERKKKG